MQILVESATGRAVLMFPDTESVVLNEGGLTSPSIIVSDVSSATHDLVEGEAPVPPLYFVPGAVAYDGDWSIINQSQYDAGVPVIEAAMAAELVKAKTSAVQSIVAHINAITQSTLTAYPAAEVESWTIQKVEAETVLAADPATLDMAPFLAGVCSAQFGPADDTARLAQVVDKAASVKANADAWAGMAAYVNGLRARTHAAILAAPDLAGVDAALAAGIAEGDGFKLANGL